VKLIRKVLITSALAAGLAVGPALYAAADEPVPDPTGTCTYDVDTATIAGSATCANGQDAGVVGGSGSFTGNGGTSGGCGSGSASGQVAGTPVESGEQGACVP
jgi:hypothetical protein